jgi:hypothetical protein
MQLQRIVGRLVQSTINSKNFKNVIDGKETELRIEVPESLCEELTELFEDKNGTEERPA